MLCDDVSHKYLLLYIRFYDIDYNQSNGEMLTSSSHTQYSGFLCFRQERNLITTTTDHFEHKYDRRHDEKKYPLFARAQAVNNISRVSKTQYFSHDLYYEGMSMFKETETPTHRKIERLYRGDNGSQK